MKINKIKAKVTNNKVVAENFLYITLLQIFLLIAPLITYPYLVNVLGRELYGLVITAQVLVSYFSILIDFGSNSIAARYVALRKQNSSLLSDLISCILSARFYLWCISLVLYVLLVSLVSTYRDHFLLFLLMFGMTLNDLLFPQFFFQGIEKMKHITIVNLVIKSLFICLVFLFVSRPDDYVLVPVFYSMGYLMGGIIALYIIIKKYRISIKLESISKVIPYVKDCSPLLAKELISTVKDKLNIFFVGRYIGMADVVVYDLGVKFISIFARPVNIIGTVLLPRFARNPNRNAQKYVIYFSFLFSLVLIVFANIFLKEIVFFFIHEDVDLLPLRLILIAPLMLSISQCIGYNYILANGFNKLMLWSIIAATSTYCVSLIFVLVSGMESNILSFIVIALLSYSAELIYRIYVFTTDYGFKYINNGKENNCKE